jgi:hypothetical protein
MAELRYEKPTDGTQKSAYSANTNHTLELSRLNAQYAEAYDKWENCRRDMERKRLQADNLEKSSVGLREKVDELRNQIKELVK